MGKLTRIQWPQEYSELQRIEELLLCGICYDYMDTSVMTSCSHNYCSLCIRKYLHYKTQCPACFEKTFEKDLHTNRIIDELITHFGKIRTKLVGCVAGAKIENDDNEESIDNSLRLTPVRPARTNHNQKRTPSKVETKRNDKHVPLVGTPEKLISSPGTSGLTKIATIFTPKSKKNSASGTTLPCPVCRVDISEFNLNKHLDDCLKRDSASQEIARTQPKRKPLPKLVFSLMKDTELRKKIREFGLPTQGDRKTLEARFQRYSTLYNAECDKREPRPIQELLKQCDEEEALEKKMLKFSQPANRLKVNRNTEQKVIEEAQKRYLESNKKNYQSLIASIKKRADKSKKSSTRRSPINRDPNVTSDESAENISPESNNNRDSEDEHSNDNSYPVNVCDNDFHDSDSDATCPLQHYTSDDPTSFLSICMSNSNENSIEATAKSSSSEMHFVNKSLLDVSASPSRNVTDNSGLTHDVHAKNQLDDILPQEYAKNQLDDILPQEYAKNQLDDILPEEYAKNQLDDIFKTDTAVDESNDEEFVPPSPKAATRHSTKRVKLSPIKVPSTDNANKSTNDRSKPGGKKLAESIARDFTLDESTSNESGGSEATHEGAPVQSPENPKVAARKNEDKPDLLRVDKENHESSVTSPKVVNRPLRKRNCVTRSQRVNAMKNTKDATIAVPAEAPRANDEGENAASVASNDDSLAKRRRRRNLGIPTAPAAAAATGTKNPPSRPLRKRNSVAKRP